MKIKQDKPESVPVVPTKTYVLNGVPYLPHYNEQDMYVSPDRKTLSLADLGALGATIKTMALWPRPWK